MKDLKPWLSENGPPELCLLLRLAREQEPSPQAIEAFISRVHIEAGAVQQARMSQPHGTRALWTMRRGLCAGVIGLAAAAFAATRMSGWSGRSEPVPAVSAAATERSSPAGTVNSLTAASAAERQDSPAQRMDQQKAPRSRTPIRSSRIGSQAVGDLELPASSSPRAHADPRPDQPATCGSRERSAIDEARGLLGDGRPGRALGVIRDYERRCQFRSFVPEALQIQMRAEAAVGQRAAARATARMLSNRYPTTAPGQEAARFLAQSDTLAF